MENEFTLLVVGLGYQVKRKRNPRPGIDLVAEFRSRPLPEPPNRCTLQRPLFSPNGVTAFSIKRGDFRTKDVTELLDDILEARESDDKLLKSIVGGVIVTNYTKTEGEIDRLLEQGVFCWDIRRLIFYATKVRIIQNFAKTGPLSEKMLSKELNGSYLMKPNGIIGSATLSERVVIFVDDHHIMLAYDHMTSILKFIYSNSLKPITRTTDYDVRPVVDIHILGLANLDLVERAYVDYAAAGSEHPGIDFSAASPLRIFQYGPAPWTSILRL